MKISKGLFISTCLSAFTVALISCGGGGGGSSGSIDAGSQENITAAEMGTVTILATDAVADQFKEVNLTIIRAEMLSDGARETLFEGEKKIDLLSLADVTEIFSVTEVPEGDYDKIRLTLTEVELVFHDERDPVYPNIPGNGKLDINPRGLFRVDAEEPLTLELDFDVEKSLHIVGKGNGGYSFRPVVFTRKVEKSSDTKLIRQQGVVRDLNELAGTFKLCISGNDAFGPGEEDCVSVDTAAVPASIFDASAVPIGLAQVSNGNVATVVGRFHAQSAIDSASASGVGFSMLAALESKAKDDENHGNKQKEKPRDDDSEDEDEKAEDETSDIDAAEEDAINDDTQDDRRLVLVADLIWLGEDIVRTENVACSTVFNAEDGAFYNNAQLPLVDDESCAEASRSTQITPETRIYDSRGNMLSASDIREGVINHVEGFFSTDGDAQVERAVLIRLFQQDEQDERRSQLSGAIGVIGNGNLALLTEEGDLCVLFAEGDTAVFEASEDTEGGLQFDERSISSLISGLEADAFGKQDNGGCLEAETIIVRAASE